MTLLEIANQLNFTDLAEQLQAINARQTQKDCNITLPLVGEFSSGKTTLINALTDSRQLETATKPTTATIYQIHFGCDRCHATAFDTNGEQKEFESISELKNDTLADANIIEVYDTSDKISKSVILVDTPGLSSPDPKHKQALVNFLPFADGILLVSDINQQLTRSISDFIKTIAPSKRPIYLVLTKADTKSDAGIAESKDYIPKNSDLKFEKVIAVSARTGNLDEFYALLNDIQASKGEIVKKVDEHRTNAIAKEMINRIDMLINSVEKDVSTEESIRRKELELANLQQTIDHLFEFIKDDLVSEATKTYRKFEDTVPPKLEAIVTANSSNYDAEALSTINNTATLLLNEFRNAVKTIIQKRATDMSQSDDAVNLQCMSSLDLSSYNIGDIAYNLNLNTEGHEYDGMITSGTKILLALGTVGVGMAAVKGAGAAVATVEAAAKSASSISTIANIADTVSDIGSMVSNHKTTTKIQRALEMANRAGDNLNKLEDLNRNYSKYIASDKGLVETMVGFVTDKAWGKPQRRKAIRDYMAGTLLPSFKEEVGNLTFRLLSDIEAIIKLESKERIDMIASEVDNLKAIKKNNKEAFNKKINDLRDYKNTILTM